MKLAFVFPGQGSQYVGMGSALAEAYAAARETFAEADDALGAPLSRLIFEGPEDELRITRNTQPALLTVSVACLRVLLAETAARPWAAAGHSLGEYSALVAAGAIEFGDAVRTVAERGRLMQEAVSLGVGGMAAVLGSDAETVARVCAEVSTDGARVEVANDNAPGQVVLSGHLSAVEEAGRRLKGAGAKRVVPLPVSAPFHCSLMVPAGDRLAAVLRGIPVEQPRFPVVANVDAVRHGGPDEIRDRLVRQVSQPVRWQGCVRHLAEEGVEAFVEVGPGKVLSGLVRRIVPGVSVANVEVPGDLEPLRLLAGEG